MTTHCAKVKSVAQFAAVTLAVLLIGAGCANKLDFSEPVEYSTTLTLYAQNDGLAALGMEGTILAVGTTAPVRTFASGPEISTSNSELGITRGSGQVLAIVRIRMVRFPDRGQHLNATIRIGEPEAGRFTATTLHPDWIEVVEVVHR